ncbi:MAG: PAS domain-containing sensor histidine kinase [Holosporaceae bacterium]|jgi:PAS domain S-box-containing protein|nr:PAS domain-containing sensor histidine kinase [Holosporaceae bacterium]
MVKEERIIMRNNSSAARLYDFDDSETIESTLATFRNFSPEKPIENAVIYFWESHSQHSDGKRKNQATIDLIYKEFDMSSCEKYEVRTGYLSRYNYLPKPLNKCTPKEIDQAILMGKQEQEKWILHCYSNLPGFVQKDWHSCIESDENPYYKDCRDLILNKRESNSDFYEAFFKSVGDYAEKHSTDKTNGELYILEEISWILSLPLLHMNKQIYLIHIGNDNFAIRALFHNFVNLQRSVKWLSPHFCKSTFVNISDFLMDYRNSYYMGYSYAIEDSDAVKDIKQFEKEKNPTKEELIRSLRQVNAENSLLKSIIGKLPGHIYWLSSDNIYLGCNDAQAESFGLKSRDDIIGKTNSMLLKNKADAKKLDEINRRVISEGSSYEGEELATFINKSGSYLSQKNPLFNDNGKVIGVLGMSINITDRKKAEELEAKNSFQRAKIEKQEEFRKLTATVAHDLISPLVSLEHFSKYNKNLPSEDNLVLQSIATSIRNITGDLLNRYMRDRNEDCANQEDHILVSLVLLEQISHKRYQYKKSKIRLDYLFDATTKFIFIKSDLSNFSRMISNLINNAMDAIEGNLKGNVKIFLKKESEHIKIIIKDNGRGMPNDFVNKINSRVLVGSTKKIGHGIGLSQVMDTLTLYNGKMLVESEKSVGTTVSLSFPFVDQPSWLASQVTLRKNSIVIVLDGDTSIHLVWKNLLGDYKDQIRLYFFLDSREAFSFIEAENDRDNIYLLSDFLLPDNDLAEILQVMQYNIQERTYFVTNVHSERMLHRITDQSSVRIIPKQFLPDVQIIME